MTPPEFSRPIRIDTLGTAPRAMQIEAEESERAALATRFGLSGIAALRAEASLVRTNDEIVATGALSAGVTQYCAASGEPVDAAIAEDFRIVFRPQPAQPGVEDEIELSDDELDVVFYDGAAIDIGEAMAETLSLSLHPFPRAPNAEEVLRAAGVQSEEEAEPLSALAAALKGQLKQP